MSRFCRRLLFSETASHSSWQRVCTPCIAATAPLVSRAALMSILLL